MAKTVAIFGGGVGGLTAAHELAERGYQVTLYEKDKIFGGKAKSMLTKNGYPCEQSLHTIARVYYHLYDTLKRIPFGTSQTVFDNLVLTPGGSRGLFLFKQFDPAVAPFYFPRSLSGMREFLKFQKDIGAIITPAARNQFIYKILKAASMCRERQLDTLENETWFDYLNIKSSSENYLSQTAEFFTAAKGNHANARAMSMIVEKFFFISLLHPIASQTSSLNVLNNPADDALFNPWTDYLQKKGVRFVTQCEAKSFTLMDKKVNSVKVMMNDQPQEIHADNYIFSVPVDVMTKIVKQSGVHNAIPSLTHIDQLKTVPTSGIQLYNKNPDSNDFPQVFMLFFDSPWGIAGLYISKALWQKWPWPPPVTGILSLAWTNFDKPGILYNKTTFECSAEEIKEEVLAQMKMHKGANFLEKLEVFDYAIDPAIVFADNNGKMVSHETPLFVQDPGCYQYQPHANTEINNLFLASDYVRTTTDAPTMEAANEAARRAVNALLINNHDRSKPCFVRNHPRTGLGLLRSIDKFIYELQHFFSSSR